MMAHAFARSDSADVFGNYKAEWLGEKIFDLFRAPAYFPDLELPRPCVLIGGRGTGKTTVLRTLSYEGRHALQGGHSVDKWPYYGFYYRVNTNRVTAFQGSDLSDKTWNKVFGHYLNLVLSQQVIRFLEWFSKQVPDVELLSDQHIADVASSLNMSTAHTIGQLRVNLSRSLVDFEAYLNNLTSNTVPTLSMQGAPLDVLFGCLRECEAFKGRSFFFLIDEYENFLDYQQVLVNTLMKHASGEYTFKIGVRELGWRKRNTINENEELNSPADYVRIDIAESLSSAQFRDFAEAVCDARLTHMFADAVTNRSIDDILPGLSEEDEAISLGLIPKIAPIVRAIEIDEDPTLKRAIIDCTPLEILLLEKRAEQRDISLASAVRERRSDPETWKNFYDNYKHAYLFTIADGAAHIRKYYAGWNTYCMLSGANIRYVLELVDNALREHSNSGGASGEPVHPRTQTIAAQNVGKKNLNELEGYREGAHLVKLVLGLGRIFGIMARDPHGHAPEQNQFSLQERAPVDAEVRKLLTSAVMHSALVRSLANKLDRTDPRSYDYTIHPVFSAFFTLSYRRKRKIKLDPEDLATLVHSPRKGIRNILRKIGRDTKQPLPAQLRLFTGHYGDAD